MAAGIGVKLLAEGDFGVDRSRLQFLIAELLLDEADARATLELACRAGEPRSFPLLSIGFHSFPQGLLIDREFNREPSAFLHRAPLRFQDPVPE